MLLYVSLTDIFLLLSSIFIKIRINPPIFRYCFVKITTLSPKFQTRTITWKINSLTLKYAACHGINEEARNANVNPKTTGRKKTRMPDWQEEILFQWVSQSYQFLPTFRKYIFIISFTFDYSFCNWDLGAAWVTALPGTERYVTANHFSTFCAGNSISRWFI